MGVQKGDAGAGRERGIECTLNEARSEADVPVDGSVARPWKKYLGQQCRQSRRAMTRPPEGKDEILLAVSSEQVLAQDVMRARGQRDAVGHSVASRWRM